MKKSCLICVAFILVILSACSRDGQGVAPRNYFCAELNGQSWEGRVESGLDNNKDEWHLGVVVYADKQQLIRREELSINKIPLNKGRYALNTMRKDSIINLLGSGYGTSKDDGDVACDYYKLLLSDSSNNYIELTEVDIERRRFKGEFSGTYIRTTVNTCDVTKSDTMRFRNGKFFIKLRD